MRFNIMALAAAASLTAAVAYGLHVDRPALATSGPMLEAQLEHVFELGETPARQPRFSLDGSLLALTNAAGDVYVLRTADRRLVRRFRHEGGATAAVFSPEARTLFTAGYDGNVRSWDLASGKTGEALAAGGSALWSLDVSADGKSLAAGGEDGIARVWRLDSPGQPPQLLRGHERNIWEVRFSPAAPQLATGSFDFTARIWDLATGRAMRTFRGHSQAIVGLDYRPDGRMIATGGDDSAIRLWRPADGAEVRKIDAGNHVYKLDFSPDGRWLLTGGRARSAFGTIVHGAFGVGLNGAPVHLWRVSDGARVAELPHPTDVFQAAFAPDGRTAVTADDDGKVRLWSLTPA